jgi:hypothetical protein
VCGSPTTFPFFIRYFFTNHNVCVSQIGCRIAQLGCRVAQIGCRVAQIGCRVAQTGCRVAQIGCRVAQIGCRVAQIGCCGAQIVVRWPAFSHAQGFKSRLTPTVKVYLLSDGN